MLATHTPTHTTDTLRSDVSRIPSEHLEVEILTLAKCLAAGTYELLVLVGEADARGTWNAWGHLSCAAWLADVCEIETSTAHNHRASSVAPAGATLARQRADARSSPTAIRVSDSPDLDWFGSGTSPERLRRRPWRATQEAK